jgi:LacI family transcriptional regulator
MKQPTMKDVAKLANVSTATVSNVITGQKYVSDDLRAAIEQAMKELSFIPNIAARSLRIKRTYIIGIVAPDITNPFYGEIINAVTQVANRKKYRVILGNANNDSRKENVIVDSLLFSGCEGIIQLSPRQDEDKLNIARKVPVVYVDRTKFDTQENIGFVYTDNYMGGQIAAQRLLERQFTRYVCIAGFKKETLNAYYRVMGFKDALARKKIAEQNVSLIDCESTFEFQPVHDLTKRLIADGIIGEQTGIFICSDIGAWGAIEAIKLHGFSIPESVGVIGYDNIQWANWLTPRLTTIDNNQAMLGKRSAEMMIQAIETGETLQGKSYLQDVHLIGRASV